jgi:glycosyltransferase involved in cell wall biosynthesis
MKPIQSISIIIPSYNEAATVGQVIERVAKLPWPVLHEIIIVDDGSTDDTQAALAAYGGTCHVEVLPQNRGKGYAMRRGVELARGEWVAFLDADLESDPHDLLVLLDAAQNSEAQAVHGSRLLEQSKMRDGTSPFFFWGGRLLTLWVNALFGLSLSDASTGLRLVRRSAFLELPLRSERFSIETELIAHHALAGHAIHEVAISYRPRKKAEGKKLRLMDGVRAAVLAMRVRLEHWRQPLRAQRPATPTETDTEIQDTEATRTENRV